VRPDEPDTWQAAAAAVHWLYDERLGVPAQSQGFTRYAAWDFASSQPQQPLMLRAPYFQLYRRQVNKQTDLVLSYPYVIRVQGDCYPRKASKGSIICESQHLFDNSHPSPWWAGRRLIVSRRPKICHADCVCGLIRRVHSPVVASKTASIPEVATPADTEM
jgi:hypothetical protein